MRNYVITGGTSGLGLAIAKALILLGERKRVTLLSNKPADETEHLLRWANWHWCDLESEASIKAVCEAVLDTTKGQIDCLINCAGINHLAYLKDLETFDWNRLMAINTRAPYLMVKNLLPALTTSQGTVLNIISNASHVPMTASAAYNASKGALHILTLQMARELTRANGITVFGISPNKMHSTGMSDYIDSHVPELRGWTREYAAEYQRKALLTGEETDPEVLADFIVYLLRDKRNHKYLSGCILPYGA